MQLLTNSDCAKQPVLEKKVAPVLNSRSQWETDKAKGKQAKGQLRNGRIAKSQIPTELNKNRTNWTNEPEKPTPALYWAWC